MGQKIVKRNMEKGRRLYNEQRYDDSIKEWIEALKKMKRTDDKFSTLGYIIMALHDMGKYRTMLDYAIQQIDLANEVNDIFMKCEAYLNLAVSNARVSEFHKAVCYCRHSLQNEPRDKRIHGYGHLCMGNAYFGLSEFAKVLQSHEKALSICKENADKTLELQVYSGLGYLFCALGDYETGLSYHVKAADTASSFDVCDLSSKYQRLTALNIATPYRKLGRFNEAMENCEDAMKMALLYSDRPVQARCLFNFAEIHRKRNDAERAYPRYESAYSIMAETGDRLGQVEVLAGMSKTLAVLKKSGKVCECKAIEINHKAMEISNTIGNKLSIMKCHARLEELYRSLGDMEVAQQHMLLRDQLIDEMELYCGVCGGIMGQKPEKLDSLSCGHMIHARCSVHLGRPMVGKRSKMRPCPTCRRRSSSNPMCT